MSDVSSLAGGSVVVVLGAVLLPSVVAVARGLRDNHMGGIVLLNSVGATCWLGSSFLGLAALAALPVIGLMFFALMAWRSSRPVASQIARPPGATPSCLRR